jgi:p70 ribosomal S6 kinase
MLTDFGLSKVAVNAKTVCGTIEFMAPEVLNSQQYNKSVDYWSLGVLMYDMLTGKPPFRGANYQKIMESILHKKPAYPKYITPQAKDLLGKLLRKMPAKRLGTETDSSVHFKKHEFFRKVDWGDVLLGQEPPYIPPLKHAEDTSNFAQEFTNCSLGSAQANAILGGDELIPSDSEPSKDPEHFVGFSFSRDCPLDHFQ